MSGSAAAASAIEGLASIAIGSTPHTRALKAATNSLAGVDAAFAEIEPISRAFAPMVRELRFDICELAVVTFLQAKAHGCPIALLPAATACRFQEGALLCRADDHGLHSPRDLRGKRVGVRAYGQTTAVWLRGILADDFGLAPEDMRWTVFEGAHVAEMRDPPFVTRAEAGAGLLDMLRGGRLDVAVVGNDKPNDPDLRPVFPDPRAAADRFRRAHGFEPVNHVVVARQSLIERWPEVAAAFLGALRDSFEAGDTAAAPPLGRHRLQPSLALAQRYAMDQGLLPRALPPHEVWDGLPKLAPWLGQEWL